LFEVEQLPEQHRCGFGQLEVGRGLCGCDFGLRRKKHQSSQSYPLGLQRLLQRCFQGKITTTTTIATTTTT